MILINNIMENDSALLSIILSVEFLYKPKAIFKAQNNQQVITKVFCINIRI